MKLTAKEPSVGCILVYLGSHTTEWHLGTNAKRLFVFGIFRAYGTASYLFAASNFYLVLWNRKSR